MALLFCTVEGGLTPAPWIAQNALKQHNSLSQAVPPIFWPTLLPNLLAQPWSFYTPLQALGMCLLDARSGFDITTRNGPDNGVFIFWYSPSPPQNLLFCGGQRPRIMQALLYFGLFLCSWSWRIYWCQLLLHTYLGSKDTDRMA